MVQLPLYLQFYIAGLCWSIRICVCHESSLQLPSIPKIALYLLYPSITRVNVHLFLVAFGLLYEVPVLAN